MHVHRKVRVQVDFAEMKRPMATNNAIMAIISM